MRCVGYVRISSEDQVGNFSLDAQRRAIEKWVHDQGWRLVKVYVDEAKTATTDNRPGFQEMRRDARRGKFEALVVHKFDRLARNRANALAVKSLLRHDYGIKVFSVTEPSEDSDGPIGALMEGIMESVADWYSRNLATEVAKGKRERAQQGYQNNQPPAGYDKAEDGTLTINPHEAEGIRLAFETYQQSGWSDTEIARALNSKGYRTKQGKLFSKEMIRDLLQNRTYLGFIRYQQLQKKSNGSRDVSADTQWYKGKHEAIISEELFEKCQQVRARAATHHLATPKAQIYPLSGILFCGYCQNKMRAQRLHGYRYYRCRARELGGDCQQQGIMATEIEQQLVDLVRQMKPPADWKQQVVQAMGNLMGDGKLEERVAQIEETIKRMDFRWDNGFITDQDEYLEKRLGLQQELEQMKPIPIDELEAAADILTNFDAYWAKAQSEPGEQQKLLHLVFERISVKESVVASVCMRPNYHVVYHRSGNLALDNGNLKIEIATPTGLGRPGEKKRSSP